MPKSSIDALIDLFARDVDKTLLARARALTPTQRIEWLEEMQSFAEAARRAREHEAQRTARDSD